MGSWVVGWLGGGGGRVIVMMKNLCTQSNMSHVNIHNFSPIHIMIHKMQSTYNDDLRLKYNSRDDQGLG